MGPRNMLAGTASLNRHTVATRLFAIAMALLFAACSEQTLNAVEQKSSELIATVKTADDRADMLLNMGRPDAFEGDLESLAEINIRDARLERVLPPIKYPYSFKFTGEREILLTQHGGRLMRYDLDSREGTEISGLPKIGSGFYQIGLMDIELHPDYANNKRVYFSYAKPHPEADTYHSTEVATAIIEDNRLTALTTLINNDQYGWAPSNFGGTLEFDDDGYLYVSIGDRGEDPLVQRGDRLEGKILRIHDDGSVPTDNPFVGREGYDPRVYALGVRNPQGLHFDSLSGLLLESEHGPMGGDEVNIIQAGGDYGYPTISYGNNYSSGKPIGEGTHKDGMLQPLFYFLPSIATSKIAVYRGEMFSEWDGDVLVGGLKAEHVAKLDFDNGVIRTHRAILQEIGGRIRDIKVAEDGSIYILSQTKGLYRLFRPPPPPPKPAPPGITAEATPAPPVDATHPGMKWYEIVCSGCHAGGAMGAPMLGDYERWKPIMDQPMELTRDHVINGYNDMPERGMCHFCSDIGLMQMVDYMFIKANENAP